MRSMNVLRYGTDEPRELAAQRPEQIALRAGPLSAIFEAGGLRYIRLGGHEVLRRIYIGVRDVNWDTIPCLVSDLKLERGDDQFKMIYVATHRQGDIDMVWQCRIEGNAQGTLTFAMDGRAHSTFSTNRTGFCVLHPAIYAGQVCVVEKADGTVENSRFPAYISADQPFREVRALTYEIEPGVRAEVRFEGEVFETEDQRNWSDSSFKSYSPPLRVSYPAKVTPGTLFHQSVTLRLDGTLHSPILSVSDVTLSVSKPNGMLMPGIGLQHIARDTALSASELERLRKLNMGHLRLELDLTHTDYEGALFRMLADAASLYRPVEFALIVSDQAEAELQGFGKAFRSLSAHPTIREWIIFHIRERATSPQWIALARRHLAELAPDALLGGGSRANFAELNRIRPAKGAADFAAYATNPQAHAVDDLTIIEALSGQAMAIDSARQFLDDMPLSIGPVTLKPRFWAPATEIAALPRCVDVRQISLLGAAWTLGSLKALSGAGGQSSLTYYETIGWLGVMESAIGSARPEHFRSIPGSVYPMYHVFADIAPFARGELLTTDSSDPLACDGLALRHGRQARLLLANLRPESQMITVIGLRGTVRVRTLDETNALQAMTEPETYRGSSGAMVNTQDGAIRIQMLPYATACIDWELSE